MFLTLTLVVYNKHKDSPDTVADTFKEYGNQTGNIEINVNMVMFTKKGLIECQKPKHEWD
jgi:hypothetical protein